MYTRSVVLSLSPSDVVTVQQVCIVYCNVSAQPLLERHTGGCIGFLDTSMCNERSSVFGLPTCLTSFSRLSRLCSQLYFDVEGSVVGLHFHFPGWTKYLNVNIDFVYFYQFLF